MKKIKFYFLSIIIFLGGFYPAFVLAFLQNDLNLISESSLIKWNRINDILFFISLIVNLSIQYKDIRVEIRFYLVSFLYGVSSIIYDDLIIKVSGGLLLALLFLVKFFDMYQESVLRCKISNRKIKE